MSPSAGGAARKSKGLPKRRLTALRKTLEEERARVSDQAERLEADFRDESWKERRSDDDAETGSSTFERERTMSLARNARLMLTAIEEALERMDAGTYGACAVCGQLIDPERLDAVPHTAECLDCRRKAERAVR